MFKKAIPLWHDAGLNTHLIFRAEGDFSGAALCVAAADFYKVYADGVFLGFGPARTAKGYARVDEYTLPACRKISIEVAGYGCSSLTTVRQQSFCCAEITRDGTVLAATGFDFACLRNDQRRQKVERFSLQRHFGEVYDMDAGFAAVEASPVEAPVFIPRRVPFADLSLHSIHSFIGGSFTQGEMARKNAYTTSILVEKDWGIFPEEAIPDKPFRFADSQICRKEWAGRLPKTLDAGQWLMLDAGTVEVGFPILETTAEADSQVILALTEYCPDDRFAFVPKMNCQPVIQFCLKAGQQIQKECFEPYSFRKAAIFVQSGCVTVTGFGWRNYTRDMTGARTKAFSDPILQGVYDAALRTFAHNAVDIYMDCPSRERAGWLCDSFFTARAEHFFFGNTAVEDVFLENYVLYRNEGEFPEGVLPMVYPSDPHENNKFIPQWDMWYVLEVCEYLTQRNPAADREIFRPSVTGVLDFLARYENEWGLLETLPSWNFVEWSTANNWTQDVNYPTNFLYAGMLEAAGAAFDLPLQEKADLIRKETIHRSFDGEVFLDHAIRLGDALVNFHHVSEAGQYYAALFGGFDLNAPEFAKLKDGIVSGFSVPPRSDFCPVNAFIGLYLRMAVLDKMGDRELLQENIRAFFGGMAEKTGTLWEYREAHKSMDHGFASFVATLM